MPRSYTQYAIAAVICLLLLYLVFATPSAITDKFSSASQPKQQNPDTEKPFVSERPKSPGHQGLSDQWKGRPNPYDADFTSRQHEEHSATLVIPKLASEMIGWLPDDGFPNMQNLELNVYVVDDPTASLTVPANKGNEAMVYLTYIIDNYENLPDISIFMHAHGKDGWAWHNDELLDQASPVMLSQLNTEKVIRDGFVQLRCEHDKVCSEDTVYLHQIYHEDEWEVEKGKYLAEVWQQFFPNEGIPDLVVNQVGAQFAVSREAIKHRSKEEYEVMRNYLLETELTNRVSGRVFEWIWHYIFTSKTVYCPSKLLCLCDTYSVCFKTHAELDQYDALFKSWESMTWSPANFLHSDDGRDVGEQIKETAAIVEMQLKKLKEAAWTLGSDEDTRRQVLYNEWERLKILGVV